MIDPTNVGGLAAFNAADPWSWDPFSPPAVPVAAPSSGPPKRPLPDQDALFTAQRRALRALAALDAFERKPGDTHELIVLRRELEATYKTIQKYLKQFAQA